MNPIFGATIQRGKVVFQNVDMFNGFLISLEGKEVEVIVRRKKKSRSLPQNAYYFGVVVKLISEETGFTPEEAHIALKMLFLQDKTHKIPTLISTTSLTTVSFEQYLEQIRQWAAQELSCVIPLPNEVDLGTSGPEHLEPTKANIKSHQEQLAKDTEARKAQLVSTETLEELFSLADNGKIMEICAREFNGRDPKDLTQEEAERLDTIIVSER